MNIPAINPQTADDIQAQKHPPFAAVALNIPLKDTFTYEIPETLRGLVKTGMRVLVPFGRRKLTGYVVGLPRKLEKNIPLKPIEELLDAEAALSEELLSLTKWIAGYYHASWGEAIKASLPAGLDDESHERLVLTDEGRQTLESGSLQAPALLTLQTVRDKKRLTLKQIRRLLKKKFSSAVLARLKNEGLIAAETVMRRSPVNYSYEKTARLVSPAKLDEEAERLLRGSPKQKDLYRVLLEGEIKLPDLARRCPSYAGPLKSLRQKGLAEIVAVKMPRRIQTAPQAGGADGPLRFSPDQERAYGRLEEAISASEYRVFLLHGVTGSGKTEIYIRCIERALQLGKTAIMLVPEISLTPQTASRFKGRFGEQVAILHSALSNNDRYQEWKKVQEGRVSVVVGARSAIFAPFKDLGVVIVDEEHDPSYKQDSSPRYHARDTAIVRARDQKAVVVLGSATPSLESRRNAESGKYVYLALPSRIEDRLLPIVEVRDMRAEKTEKKNFSILSSGLKTAIRLRLERGEQTFLFLNRRGTSNYVFCKECGFVFHCPRCSVTLTFHGSHHSLLCHYCDFRTPPPGTCAECSGEVIRFAGFGTQKLEEDVRRLFPQARISRLDRDTARNHADFETMYRSMTAGEIDILIGTQMIAKGHDFPNVTLVGVVHADLSLNIPDFRSGERSFQLLTQVAGRAGRGNVPGQVIIQTHNPEHYVFQFVRDHDYEKFYETEIVFRRKLHYPPFTRMALLEVESADESLAADGARTLKSILVRQIRPGEGIELLGPSRAVLYKINDKFRWRLILRCRDNRPLQSLLEQSKGLPDWRRLASGKIKLTIDIDPVNLL
ncbi:MAG: primosomal protein N' [Nitrospinae bacterium]|nr:primosomal protein N' [Nitrospinota bacterium]